MKKRFLAFALILSILCSVSPLPALAETPDSSQSTEVIFEITENDVTPTYGWLKFGPSYSLKNVVGTYTGTIYFNISVINDDV